MLLEHPGKLVPREDLRKRLWPNDTVVEFEHSISAAMNRLRQALGDSAENPRFIETLARRGYRWKTPVEWGRAAPDASEAAPTLAGQNLVGKRVSHYRVLEVLGGGGMGLLYKAEDLKLGRRVALKFLPEELAADPVALERFRREARAASAPDHPNICTIYEVGEYEGTPFISMQLLQGQTLGERIAAGSPQAVGLPLEELVSLAIQVADGLNAAHGEGIIHRDIKPANIFVTNRGDAKILDFGLAKLADAGEHSELREQVLPNHGTNPSDLSLTRTGAALGTASYMSPEQVRGEKLDVRTDLFSFGLVLYEMATGQRAFAGKSAVEVHDEVLKRTPVSIRSLNPQAGPRLEKIIEKALQKEREVRYQSASEMRADLESLKREVEPTHTRRWRMVGAVGALLIAGAISWLATREPTSPQVLRDFKQRQLTVNSSENPTTGGAISPDGKYLAFTDLSGIHVKNIETGETQLIPQPEVFKENPPQWQSDLWWPDSSRFLLWAGNPHQGPSGWKSSVWSASVIGGAPRKLFDEGNPWGVSPDGSVVAITTKNDHEIWLVGGDGQPARKIDETDGSAGFRSVQWSPDGQRLAYIRGRVLSDKYEAQIESRDLKGGPPTVMLLLNDVSQLPPELQDFVWLPDGRVIYVGGEPDIHGFSCNFRQASVDERTGKIVGEPRCLTNWAGFCVTGLSRTADGKKLAFVRSSDLLTVYVAEFDAAKLSISTPRRITFTDDMSSPTAWTPDSKAVLIRSNREGSWGIYRQDLNSNAPEPIVTGLRNVPYELYDSPVSPDRNWILYDAHDPSDSAAPVHLMRVPLSGGLPEQVIKGHIDGARCPRSPGSACVIGELTQDKKQIIFTALDPVKGRGRELTRFGDEHADYLAWDLSPDGTQIVLYKEFEGRFRLLSLNRRVVNEIGVTGGAQLRTMSWAADGKGLFAANAIQQGAQLLYIDLRGNAHVLWQLRGRDAFVWGRPSPDGRHLAILGGAGTANVWMMENF
jgi:serine/threonine protein kinase